MSQKPNFFKEDGSPKYVRCYDNGGSTIDRYTVVFTGRYRHKTGGVFWNYGLSANPCHPQGVGSLGEGYEQIDRPSYSHLGKPIAWADLPEAVRNFIMSEYRSLWLSEYPREFGEPIA
jgi:hypothetical protein